MVQALNSYETAMAHPNMDVHLRHAFATKPPEEYQEYLSGMQAWAYGNPRELIKSLNDWGDEVLTAVSEVGKFLTDPDLRITLSHGLTLNPSVTGFLNNNNGVPALQQEGQHPIQSL